MKDNISIQDLIKSIIEKNKASTINQICKELNLPCKTFQAEDIFSVWNYKKKYPNLTFAMGLDNELKLITAAQDDQYSREGYDKLVLDNKEYYLKDLLGKKIAFYFFPEDEKCLKYLKESGFENWKNFFQNSIYAIFSEENKDKLSKLSPKQQDLLGDQDFLSIFNQIEREFLITKDSKAFTKNFHELINSLNAWLNKLPSDVTQPFYEKLTSELIEKLPFEQKKLFIEPSLENLKSIKQSMFHVSNPIQQLLNMILNLIKKIPNYWTNKEPPQNKM